MQESLEEKVKKLIQEEIRPRTRVDGGDIMFESMAGDLVTLGAYGDCASCQCLEPDLKVWLTDCLERKTGETIKIKINRYIPYYAR